MKIDVYRKKNNGMVFYVVPEGENITSMSFSEEVERDSNGPIKKQYEIADGESRIGVDVQDIKNQIEAGGYAVTKSEIVFNES